MILSASIILAVAFLCDPVVANWVHAHNLGPALRSSKIAKVVKWPGDFRFTLFVAATIMAVDRKQWRVAPTLALGGIIAGLIYTVVKWSVGRTRPFPRNMPTVPPFQFHPFQRGIEGLWKADNQAFPSGHVCLAFATAEVLAAFFPRGRYAFYFVATLVGVERVLEGAHYPADVAGGAIFGILSAFAAMRMIQVTLSASEGKRTSHE